jgi:hypothetical protein
MKNQIKNSVSVGASLVTPDSFIFVIFQVNLIKQKNQAMNLLRNASNKQNQSYRLQTLTITRWVMAQFLSNIIGNI